MQEWLTSIGLMEINELTVLVRVLLAVFCGGALGIERTRKLRAAGLRTYIMVCLGACTAMLVGEFVTFRAGMGDPTRIAAQVVSGIGFIGAGTIIFTGYNRVRGLTTAAGLWANAALGLAIGAGMYMSALIILVVLLAAMIFGSKFQDKYLSTCHRFRCYMILEDEASFKRVLALIAENSLHIVDFESNTVVGSCIGLALTVDLPAGMKHETALSLLQVSGGTAFMEEI